VFTNEKKIKINHAVVKMRAGPTHAKDSEKHAHFIGRTTNCCSLQKTLHTYLIS
jgi:hypothetical protein